MRTYGLGFVFLRWETGDGKGEWMKSTSYNLQMCTKLDIGYKSEKLTGLLGWIWTKFQKEVEDHEKASLLPNSVRLSDSAK